jgi:predicted nucleic acid-binding protein
MRGQSHQPRGKHPHRPYEFSFWDGLILRAALQAGCTLLFSEDMQETRKIDGVKVVNPFSLVLPNWTFVI